MPSIDFVYNQDKQVHRAPFDSHVLHSTNKSTECALVCTFRGKYLHLFAVMSCTQNNHPRRRAYVVRAPVPVFGTQSLQAQVPLGLAGLSNLSSQVPLGLGAGGTQPFQPTRYLRSGWYLVLSSPQVPWRPAGHSYVSPAGTLGRA